jgi:hypothetical protein
VGSDMTETDVSLLIHLVIFIVTLPVWAPFVVAKLLRWL